MLKELTPTQYGKQRGYSVFNLGAGFAHVKEFGKPETQYGIGAQIQISSACDCSNGRVQHMSDACHVYLDDGKNIVKSETVIGFAKAVELGDSWAASFAKAAA